MPQVVCEVALVHRQNDFCCIKLVGVKHKPTNTTGRVTFYRVKVPSHYVDSSLVDS